MPILLYVETNFLMSYAMGRDPETDRLVSDCPASIELVLPSPCFMEALTTLEVERKRRGLFSDGLEREIGVARRDVMSPASKLLAGHLQASLVEFQVISSGFETRLFRAIKKLSDVASLIDPTPRMIQSSIDRSVIEDPTDNLILACILAHAEAHPSETKAFLTENRKCFSDNVFARAALQAADIKYFAAASNCLEWHRAWPGP